MVMIAGGDDGFFVDLRWCFAGYLVVLSGGIFCVESEGLLLGLFEASPGTYNAHYRVRVEGGYRDLATRGSKGRELLVDVPV